MIIRKWREVFYTEQAGKELRDLPVKIGEKFMECFKTIIEGKELPAKCFKKLEGKQIFEFRVKSDAGTFRGLAGEKGAKLILVRFFKKSTQKTPLQEINIAIKRIKMLG